jgi:bifunctional DNA-binding transcriptional regulator/antitoxin component of YhaV-PrlF toxin-antitoxin module
MNIVIHRGVDNCRLTPILPAGVGAMATVMGPKGQVTISKEIRERLGIGPGWMAVQHVVGEHVELHFVSPEQDAAGDGHDDASDAGAWLHTVEMRQ